MKIPFSALLKFAIFSLLTANMPATSHAMHEKSIDSTAPPTIEVNSYNLVFHNTNDSYGIRIYHNDTLLAYNPAPAIIELKKAPYTAPFDTAYGMPYNNIEIRDFGIIAKSAITTDDGTVFDIKDIYTAIPDKGFEMTRDVTVASGPTAYTGFASCYKLIDKSTHSNSSEYEFFIPSILYKDTDNLRRGAIASELDVDRMYVKETRCGLPLAMLRNKAKKHSVAIQHLNPEISAGKAGGGTPGEINDSLKYGAVGYTMSPIASVGFRYPSAEGPFTYEYIKDKKPDEKIWSARYHSTRTGNSHRYKIAIIPDCCESYNGAMTTTFAKAYEIEMPMIAEVDMDAIYRQNIDIFVEEYRSYGKGNSATAGLPWSLDLPDGKNTEGVSFQMGFVGQQIAVGYHLYRYGLDNNDIEIKQKGRSMVDFWVSDRIMHDFFPTVWWDPAEDENGGRRRDYPTFLRCMVDGMEGLLDACRIANAHGEPQNHWNKALFKVADNLAAIQNDDGSFYRAYDTNGKIAPEWDRNTQADSKLNTPVAVRFMAKMYEYSNDEKYLNAALKAADFSYNELYAKKGKYVGGTPDNPNTVDKEAAIFALYAFNAAHELTGESKYLEAACHAALCAFSWTYCYDFAVPDRNAEDALINPFSEGGTIGFSVIASGHSGADNFIAYTFYEIFKLYIKTGNKTYLHMAKFLQNNTKLNTDFDGRMGYKYRAFMPEATNIADLSFRSVSLWLPWSSIANIEPIVHLVEAFNVSDINMLPQDTQYLKKELKDYGIGGKPLRR